MNRTAGMFWLAALLVALLPRAASAQSATTTIWDGVYTEEQADRGKQSVQTNCGACHNSSDWATASFLKSWVGQPIGELHARIQNTMPYDSPGRLSSQEYADIVAYILKINSVPAGKNELPADQERLSKIQVTQRTASAAAD